MIKNIHVLPTNKPSRLYVRNDVTPPFYSNFQGDAVNIYITSDEEIKEGDWVLFENSNAVRKAVDSTFTIGVNNIRIHAAKKVFKIIITTDQDLIKDGVQAIDDEFLEWFVKNPSCEYVEIEKWTDYKLENDKEVPFFNYKIIIPKEELKYPIGGYAPGYYMCNCSTCKKQFQGDKRAVQCEPCAIEMIKEEPKQETLEKAAEKRYPFEDGFQVMDIDISEMLQLAFINGAKWQQERSYSEEEVKSIVNKTVDKFCTFFSEDLKQKVAKEWFEQFKNK
jgi:hypothetical protein